VSASAGTIPAADDVDTAYDGTQVSVTNNQFTFHVIRPTGATVPVLTAVVIDAAAEGSVQNSTVLAYTLPAVQRFDFNGVSGVTQSGAVAPFIPFKPVNASDTFPNARGYGWVTPANPYDASSASKSFVAMYR